MVNYTLGALARVDNRYIHPPSSNEILFHVNDPRNMGGFKKDSTGVPDINIVPLTSAKRVHNLQGGNWSDLREKSDLAPPKGHPFEWRDIFGVVELKRFGSIKLEFPESYEVLPDAPVPPWWAQASGVSSGSTSTTDSVAPSSAELDSNSIRDGEKPSWHTITTSVSTGRVDASPVANLPPASEGEGDATKVLYEESKYQKKNIKKYAKNKAMREAITQCGSCAVEMLNCSPGRRHAIALVVVDKYLWTWWYDRQGAIQSTGINIIKDLPRFLVLLLAFQRFGLANWGYDTELDPSIAQPTANEQGEPITYPEFINIQFGQGVEVMVHPQEILHRTYSLVGRGTYVIGATHLAGMESLSAVAKMSWPDKRRTHKKAIIDCARGGDKTLSLHLPVVIAHRDGYDTEVIRKQLEITAHSPRPSRVFCIVIFKCLFPINQLSPEDFMTAWIQCIKCHFLIWPHVQHRDLSLRNLMYQTRGGRVWGVVNDWDLSFVVSKSSPIEGFTATIPFMALELLYKQPPVKHQYRHDLESFMWIAIWVFLSNNGGTDSPPAQLRAWCDSRQIPVYHEKLMFLLDGSRRPVSTEAWRSMWVVAAELTEHIGDEWLMRLRTRLPEEKSNEERVALFLRIVKTHLPPGYQFPDTPTIPELDSQ